MNPHQAPMQPPGIYNNQPQQQTNNVIPSNYQQMAYQYPQQYLPPNPPVVGYNPIYQNPQANPQSNMRSIPQRDFLSGNQHNQMMHQQHAPPMHNQQMDVLSNVEDHFRPNPVQWPSAPRPFQSDQQFYQYPSNQQHMYMQRPLAPTSTQPPPPPPQQPNYSQMRPPFYTSYPQHISPHSSTNLRSYQTIKIAKKANTHQMAKNQNKSNNPNQNHNQTHAVSQQKPKQNKSSKKQKKHSGQESKKQSGRDMSSIDRIPTSTIIDKQIQKWGWVLPPLPQRSLSGISNNSSSNPTVAGTTNSNTSDNQPSAGFTFSLKSIMTQEEEEINNENNDDEIIYNNDSEDDGNNNNSDDSDNNDEEIENDNESISNSENDSEEFEDNDSEQEGSNDDQSIDLDSKYRGTPVKRALFLWDQLFNL